MASIYSPANISDIIPENAGSNGDIVRTTSINRKSKGSSIYVEMNTSGSVIPTVYRGYYDEDQRIQYKSKTYKEIGYTNGTSHIVFDFDEYNNYNYVSYYVSFEITALSGATVNIFDIGLTKDVIAVTETIKQNSCKLISDINNNPLSYQKSTETNTVGLYILRQELQDLINVVDKPYYVVNKLNNCLDMSTPLLIKTNYDFEYVFNNPQYMIVTLNNIVSL